MSEAPSGSRTACKRHRRNRTASCLKLVPAKCSVNWPAGAIQRALLLLPWPANRVGVLWHRPREDSGVKGSRLIGPGITKQKSGVEFLCPHILSNGSVIG